MLMRVFILLTILTCAISAQSIKGLVLDKNGIPLPGAVVRLANGNTGTETNSNGEFVLSGIISHPVRIIISYVGFKTDTILVQANNLLKVVLTEDATLSEVQVTGKKHATYIDAGPAKKEIITTEEIKKAACCDLAGCFETQGTVQAVTTNILTNAKELRVLGLSGVYNQILFDGFPLFQGASYGYGVSSYPGILVKNIFISKGTNSVLQGAEGISGQLNIVPPGSESADNLLLNLYVNSFSEKQMSGNFLTGFANWRNFVSLYTVQPGIKSDENEDGFLDIPLVRKYAVFNQLTFDDVEASGIGLKIGARYLHEERLGGQMKYQQYQRNEVPLYYNQIVNLQQPEFTLKFKFVFNETTDLVVTNSTQFHKQESVFGTTYYDAKQIYTNTTAAIGIIYHDIHEIKGGISLKTLDLTEDIVIAFDKYNRTFAGRYREPENVRGVFIENLLDYGATSLLTGIRLDYFGAGMSYVTPRIMLKHSFDEYTTLRLSAGTGLRTSHIFAENLNLLVSSRDVFFKEKLKPERAYTLGLNFVKDMDFESSTWSVSLDFYQTGFYNQNRLDYDTNPSMVFVENFTGTSVSNSLQIESKVKLFRKVELKATYCYLDVYQVLAGKKKPVPLNTKNRVLFSVNYGMEEAGLQFDIHFQWFGSQRLPESAKNPVQFRQISQSPAYTILNGQITKTLANWDLYTGVENVLNYTQEEPIISWRDPFGRYFDTSFNWGPVKGRELYAGVRYRMELL